MVYSCMNDLELSNYVPDKEVGLPLTAQLLSRYTAILRGMYKPVLYHNYWHALGVMQITYLMMREAGMVGVMQITYLMMREAGMVALVLRCVFRR